MSFSLAQYLVEWQKKQWCPAYHHQNWLGSGGWVLSVDYWYIMFAVRVDNLFLLPKNVLLLTCRCQLKIAALIQF